MTTMMLAVLMFFAGCLAGDGVTDEAMGSLDGEPSSTTVVNNYYTTDDEPPLMQMNGTATECWDSPAVGYCSTVAGLMMTTNGTTAIEVVAMWTNGYYLVSNCSSQTSTTGIPNSGSMFLLTDGGTCNHYIVWIFESGRDYSHLSFSWSNLYRSHTVDPQSWPHATGYTPTFPSAVGNLTGWNFQASDADDQISGASDDTLLRVAWTSAEVDLNWSLVTFTLEKGDNVFSCSTQADADCIFDQQGSDDTKWEHDEIIYVKEGVTNICGAADGSEASCTLDITVSYNGIMVAGTPERSIA